MRKPVPTMSETAATARPEKATSDDTARKAGRGGLAVAGAKVYFILVGLIQQIALGSVLGIDGYGALSTALGMASICYNPIVTFSIQGVSRSVAHSPDSEQPAALRRAFSVHSVIAVIAALGFFLVAPTLGRALGAMHVVTALRILSGVMLLYGLYAPLIGALNGKKRFVAQAGLDATAATLRTTGLIAGAWWFSRQASDELGGVEGATLGFVGGASLIFCVSLLLVGIGRSGTGGPSVGEYLRFALFILVGQALLNVLFQSDALLLRRFAADSALAAGMAAERADPLVGAYRAAQLFCFLPYQLLLAVTFILFPMLANAHRDGDRDAVRRYVMNGVRLAAVLMGLMVSVTSSLNGQLIHLVYGQQFADLGGRPMSILSLGLGAFALFGILTSVLNSLKHEIMSMIVTALAVLLVGALCFALAHDAEFGAAVLWRTATATSLALLSATVVAAVLVKRTTGGVVAPLTLVRVGGAMTLAILLGRFLPEAGKLMTLVYSAVVALTYLTLLLVTRELGATDLANLKAVVSKKRDNQG